MVTGSSTGTETIFLETQFRGTQTAGGAPTHLSPWRDTSRPTHRVTCARPVWAWSSCLHLHGEAGVAGGLSPSDQPAPCKEAEFCRLMQMAESVDWDQIIL